MNDELERDLRALLAERASVTSDEIDAVRAYAGRLPSRHARLRAVGLLRVAAVLAVVAIGGGALAIGIGTLGRSGAWVPPSPSPTEGDPDRWAQDPRLLACTGVALAQRPGGATATAAFEMQRARDYWRHLPAMGRSPELEVDDPALVTLLQVEPDTPQPSHPRGEPTQPPTDARYDVCIVVGPDPEAGLNYYPDVDVTGLAVTLIADPSPTPGSTRTGDPTSDLPPAWALELSEQLECDGPVPDAGYDRGEGPASPATGTASVGPWLESLYEPDLPLAGWRIEPQTRWEYGESHYTRHVHRAGGRVKAIILMEGTSRQNAAGIWRVTAWRSCAPEEFDAAAGRTSDRAPLFDAAGLTDPDVTTLPGPGHCDWQSTVWLRLNGEVYFRDPLGMFAAISARPYATLPSLPAGAVDAGFRSARWHVFTSADPESVLMLTPSGVVEVWPRAVSTPGCM